MSVSLNSLAAILSAVAPAVPAACGVLADFREIVFAVVLAAHLPESSAVPLAAFSSAPSIPSATAAATASAAKTSVPVST